MRQASSKICFHSARGSMRTSTASRLSLPAPPAAPPGPADDRAARSMIDHDSVGRSRTGSRRRGAGHERLPAGRRRSCSRRTLAVTGSLLRLARSKRWSALPCGPVAARRGRLAGSRSARPRRPGGWSSRPPGSAAARCAGRCRRSRSTTVDRPSSSSLSFSSFGPSSSLRLVSAFSSSLSLASGDGTPFFSTTRYGDRGDAHVGVRLGEPVVDRPGVGRD